MSLSRTIKSIQDTMRKDAGIDGDAQRIGQLSWLLFFKIFSDLELQAELEHDSYQSPIPRHLRWGTWADESVLGGTAPTGDELLRLVNDDLFPSFRDLDLAALDGLERDRAAMLRSVFDGTYNYMKSGTLLRQVVNRINYELDFNESKTRHVFGDLYEQVLKDLQGAGNAGEFYTPRAVTQFAVDMIDPQPGETVLDPACGTGGFLTLAYEKLRAQAADVASLADAKASIRGFEKKPLPHLLCVTNLMVHGVEVPRGIKHVNTLARPLRDYGRGDQVDVILTNPPFVGMEEDGIAENFPLEFRTKDTADLFLLLVTELLKEGGRAAIVLPDSSLFGEGVKQLLRQRLVDECDLHTIVRLPHGVFSPYTDIRTNILFFTKGTATQKIWFYEVTPLVGDKYTKTKPIAGEDFDDLRSWWGARTENECAYAVSRDELDGREFNLDVPNPHREDVYGAFKRASDTRTSTLSDLEARVGRLKSELVSAPWPIGTRASEFLTTVASLVGTAPLTSGFLDELRLAVTEIALHGDLSRSEESDEAVDETLSRYQGAGGRAFRGRPKPPFDIPSHWRWTQLHEISNFQLGRTPPTKSSEFWEWGGQKA